MNFRARYAQELPSYQITPMIDVVFLMLCFFVTSQIFSQWETEIGVQLPTVDNREVQTRLPGEIIINLLQDGKVVVQGQTKTDAELAELLGRIAQLWPGHPVLIRADKRTLYEHVIKVLDLCRRVDIWNISFATGFAEGPSAP